MTMKSRSDRNQQDDKPEPNAGSFAWFREQSQKKALRRNISTKNQGIPHDKRRYWN